MSIIRKRSAAHKAYIPSNARDNQYIIAQFSLSDELLTTLSPHWSAKDAQPYSDFYQNLSELFFKLCQEVELKNSLFIANDKLARVRYSNEMHQWQTNQQILFFYNPSYHQLSKAFYDGDVRATKISLLFLADGENIRINAANFHAKIIQLLGSFKRKIAIDVLNIRVRDHQHLTYDLFAKQKGCQDSVAHKFRQVYTRYANQNVKIPLNSSEMTYAIIDIPVTNDLLNLVDIDPSSTDPYNPLYAFITDAFTLSAKHYNLNNGTLIANGLVPIIRHSDNETMAKNGELQILGFDPQNIQCGMVSKWDANELVSHVQLIFVATSSLKNESHDNAYARFLNQIELAMRLMITELELSPIKDQIILRFHQHIGYDL